MSRTVSTTSQRRRRVDPPASVDAIGILEAHGEATNEFLKTLRHRYIAAPGSLLDAIDYSVLAGGKRLRPALILESYVAHGGSMDDKSSTYAAALAAAG